MFYIDKILEVCQSYEVFMVLLLEKSGSQVFKELCCVCFIFVYFKNLQIAKSTDGFQFTLDVGVKSQHHLNALVVTGEYSGIAFWISLGIRTFPTLEPFGVCYMKERNNLEYVGIGGRVKFK